MARRPRSQPAWAPSKRTLSGLPRPEIYDLLERGEAASERIDLDEAATRALIDQQLRAGWEADTNLLRYSAETRPAKGHNLAIAEWPTAKGPADYALFV